MSSVPPARLRKFLKAFDKAQDHVVLTDARGVILYANRAAERHTGFSRRAMLGKKPGEVWGGKMPPSFYLDMWRTISRDRQPFVGEVLNHRRSGRTYWQELHVLPVLDRRSVPRFFLGIECDMDDPDRRGNLVALAGGSGSPARVQWPLEWLLASGSLSQPQLTELQRLYPASSVDALLADLLVASDPRALEMHPRRRFSLHALARQVVAVIRREYPRRRYSLRIEASDLVLYENDRLLRAALLRLVRNAAQFTSPRGGTVAVRVARSGDTCAISVEDNGSGISEADQLRLFRKFHRGREARRRYQHGAGLGLFVAHTIAQARGWDISCMSAPGKGTRMQLLLPLRVPAGR